jgi:hypothetical protein
MQNGEVHPRPQLMPMSPGGIPGALSKAERYRFLNQPWQAESMCRDVLAIDPTNQPALILLVLSLTDQFEQGVNAKSVLQIAEGLTDAYHRTYYSGIIREREAIAVFRGDPDYRTRRGILVLFRNAMESYRQAQEIRPVDNDDAVLRWNACVRFIERNWEFK